MLKWLLTFPLVYSISLRLHNCCFILLLNYFEFHGPMDIPSSQQKNEQSSVEKKKLNDGFNVLADQMKAVEEIKDFPLRKFKLETVCIDTVSGEPLFTKMWITDQEFVKTNTKKEKDIYKCEICDKTFDKRQKMLLHARFHKP